MQTAESSTKKIPNVIEAGQKLQIDLFEIPIFPRFTGRYSVSTMSMDLDAPVPMTGLQDQPIITAT